LNEWPGRRQTFFFLLLPWGYFNQHRMMMMMMMMIIELPLHKVPLVYLKKKNEELQVNHCWSFFLLPPQLHFLSFVDLWVVSAVFFLHHHNWIVHPLPEDQSLFTWILVCWMVGNFVCSTFHVVYVYKNKQLGGSI